MSGSQHSDLSTLQRCNRLKIDDAFYERNTFDSGNLDKLLWEFLSEYQLADTHLEALMALSAALKGKHPRMALGIKRIPKGRTPRPLREQRKANLAMAIADRIDIQVAQGVKQDAVIEEVMKEKGISRRDIFRMLKNARKERLVLKSIEHQLADWDCWYEGYDIADDGRLVTSLKK